MLPLSGLPLGRLPLDRLPLDRFPVGAHSITAQPGGPKGTSSPSLDWATACMLLESHTNSSLKLKPFSLRGTRTTISLKLGYVGPFHTDNEERNPAVGFLVPDSQGRARYKVEHFPLRPTIGNQEHPRPVVRHA